MNIQQTWGHAPDMYHRRMKMQRFRPRLPAGTA